MSFEPYTLDPALITDRKAQVCTHCWCATSHAEVGELVWMAVDEHGVQHIMWMEDLTYKTGQSACERNMMAGFIEWQAEVHEQEYEAYLEAWSETRFE